MALSSSNAKRPTDGNYGECPFSIQIVNPKDKTFKITGKKRRKHKYDDGFDRKLLQRVPFEPRGRFKTYGTMDVHYVVKPAKQWTDMTRYNSFILNGGKYCCGNFIFVANESTIERQKSNAGNDPRKLKDYWVARILEIRARDEHHVYARVVWMYWPDELGQGRQPYHGSAELIASNHMDIINAVSVTSVAVVNHLIEDKDDGMQSALYWRQALDVRSFELSTIRNVCGCNQPENPDKMLVGCGNSACGNWIHEECLKHHALMRVFETLGRFQPYVSENTLALKEAEDAVLEQHSIDVDGSGKEIAAAAAEGDSTTRGAAPDTNRGPGRPHKRQCATLQSFKHSKRPYEGLFEANLFLNPGECGPAVIEIKDVRTNVTSRDRIWQETAECPICGWLIR